VSHVLIVVETCACIFVLICLSPSPKLFLGFELDLRSGGLPASKEQPQHFSLPLGSGVVSYRILKVQFRACSSFHVGVETSSCLHWNFWLPEVSAQTIGTSDCC
jgi:hypothetical protein